MDQKMLGFNGKRSGWQRKGLALGIGATLVALGLWPYVVKCILKPAGWAESAYYAETISPVISGLSLVFVVYALFIQMCELDLQRKEIVRLNRGLRTQHRQSQVERSQTVFFELLRHHRQVVENLRTGKMFTEGNLHGIEGLWRVWGALKLQFEGIANDPTLTLGVYDGWYQTQQIRYLRHLGSYFRLVETTLKHVLENSRSEEQTQASLDVLKAILSDEEKGLLFLYASTTAGYERIGALCEKAALFSDSFVSEKYENFIKVSPLGGAAFGKAPSDSRS